MSEMDLLYRKAMLQDSLEIARLSGQLGYPAKAEQIEARLAPMLNAADHVQGKRIGQQLVRHCEEWARTKGYQELRVRVNVTREEAHQFYKHAGFENTKTQQVFRKGL
ncbi:GNAT family N-acetyltransferase [Paenibacillus elgii]|uniref:GNAT family N-acetyltransferase n=1 Tax=Paenibacillus elgii TaxID=189691 RepID=UPI001F315744|nr:GNAT family N-acetyltransferase [Paenibacillus elgii]